MEKRELTDFQREGVGAVEAVLAAHDVTLETETQGENETYVVMAFAKDGHAFEVYVYEDAAGVLQGERWTPFEKHDYDELRQVIRALAELVEVALQRIDRGG